MKRAFRLLMMMAAYALTITGATLFQSVTILGQTNPPPPPVVRSGTTTVLFGRPACDCSVSQSQCGCIMSS
ncbi:MAG TPA: hypothetical protein VF634_13605 [Pyrinomonadaceae bacterium]